VKFGVSNKKSRKIGVSMENFGFPRKNLGFLIENLGNLGFRIENFGNLWITIEFLGKLEFPQII